MKRSAWFAVVGALFLLTANCSQHGQSSVGQGSGGSGGVKTGAGGSGGSSSSGGSRAEGGAGGSGGSSGSGGTTTSTTNRDAAASGGVSGSGGGGGTTTSTTKRDAGASGGVSGSSDASAQGGSGGASTAKGGATGSGGAQGGATGTGGPGTGGKTGAGGATGTGGTPDGGTIIDGGVTASAPSAGCGKATTLKSARASIDVNGKTREYILALPTNYDQNHPYRLIFGWHPWTGSAQMVASGKYFGLQPLANDQAIFVAGEGQDYQDAGLGWGNSGGVDLDFLQAMLERFRSELCIDENRIFSVGFSFGAMFSFTLGCESDTMMRAIMPMAGNTMTSGGCAAGTRKVAVMAFIGTDDSLLDGHRQAVATYAQRDGCSTTTTPMQPSWCDGLAAKNLPCTCVSYDGCASGYPVISCEYKAPHQQAPNPGPIWDFLAQF